jgi:hypothetical protein
MEAGGYIDIKAALANALGTAIGGLSLTVLYFALGQKLLRPPRLSGTWFLESSISQTKFNPFRGMVLRYKILLLQDGTKLHGTAEKIYEESDKVRVFTGVNRSTATLDGTVQKAYVGRSTIFLHVVEKGKQRSFSWIMEARCRRFGRHMYLTGRFSGTAGDASGTVALAGCGKTPFLHTDSNIRFLDYDSGLHRVGSAAPIGEVLAIHGIPFVAAAERQHIGVSTKTRMNASPSRGDRVIQPLKDTYLFVLRRE